MTITTKTKQEGKENYQYVGPLQWLITCELEISRKKDKEAEIKIFKEMIEIFSNLKICIFRVVNEASRTKKQNETKTKRKNYEENYIKAHHSQILQTMIRRKSQKEPDGEKKVK